MDDQELEALRAALQAVPVAAGLSELDSRRILLANERAASIFGVPAADLVGDDVLDHIDASEREAARTALAAIASNVVEGYQARRRFVRPDGTGVIVNVWGRRLDAPDGPIGLWVLTPDDEAPAVEELGPSADVVLALTDHDWLLEFVSSNATLLGDTRNELVGTPLLGLVHPTNAAEFLAAAGRAITSGVAVTIRTRLHCKRDGWADRYCLMVPMCEHDPPRLGVVVTSAPLAADASGAGIAPHVWHSAVEARALDALRALPALPPHPDMPELTVRQVEIISKVIAGDATVAIARSLYLSPSTVRNHLTAIYRKFGVHSRADLLATLLRAASPSSLEDR